VESRRIFRKLKSYVTYRFAATIQIVIVLTLLIFISDCPILSLYVIILALFNDLTMLPIAYDRQQASSTPESPDVGKMLFVSGGLGLAATGFSLLFAYGADSTGFFKSDLSIQQCGKDAQAAIWLQMFIAAEVLIFSARAPSYFWCSLAPSPALLISVMMGCLACSVLAATYGYFGALPVQDIALIWLYDLINLLFVDALKVQMLKFLDENTDVLAEFTPTPAPEGHGGHGHDAPAPSTDGRSLSIPARQESRADAMTNRMSEWAVNKDERISVMRQSAVQSTSGTSAAAKHLARKSIAGEGMNARVSLSASGVPRASLNGSSAGNIRPYTPASKAIHHI